MFRTSLLSRAAASRRVEALLIVLFAALTFLLGCFELLDNDVWWHLRGGEWILQNGRVPDLDPFSFGSADRRWVDLHWLFQVVLALAARAGGLAGVVALAAAVGAAALLTALAARPAGTPWPLALLAWLPALVLASNRFDPRPEMFTLLYLAGFLAVLAHVEQRPCLAWALPAMQLFWVNMHGLFIFGPIVLALWWLAWAARRPWRDAPPQGLRHLVGASAAVVACCLLNPYGLEGTLLPLQLYPKVAREGNPYKDYIEEFMSPRRYASWAPAEAAAGRWVLGTFHFLLLLVPLGLLLPALWEAARPRLPGRERLWLAVLLAAILLLLLRVAAPAALAQAVPWLLLAAGAAGAFVLRGSRPAAVLCLSGAIALSAWSVWLRDYLGPQSPSTSLLVVAVLAGGVSAGLIVRHGGRLFHLLLAGAFAYLALQAVNSFARFGLIAGVLLAAGPGSWVARLRPFAGPAAWTTRLALLVFLAGAVAAVATERYGRWIGDSRRLALRERPLTFAHDAARFAGQGGLPRHALVYDLAQSCVYVYHNAPQGKVYMDARLETPSLQTFRTYVRIEQQLGEPAGRWPEALERLGKPLLLLSHEGNTRAEAAVLAHPDWRCIYFDALAAVFVPRTAADRDSRFPTFDPLTRHFREPRAASIPDGPGAAWKETKALYNLATSLRRPGSPGWGDRIPWLLAALDRAEQALGEDPDSAGVWTVLGNCYWNLVPDLGRPPPAASAPWDPGTGLLWAQSTYCFRQALERAPKDERILYALLRSYGLRRMADAQRDVALRLLATGRLPADRARALGRLVDQIRPAGSAPAGRNRSWAAADAAAGAWMHLGQPVQARAVWQEAIQPPSEAVRLERLASTYWVERDFDEALPLYRRAWRAEPRRAEPGRALAWLHTQRGDAREALRACRDTLRLDLPAPLAQELRRLEQMIRTAIGRQGE